MYLSQYSYHHFFLFLITAIVTTGGFLFGFNTCIIASALLFIGDTFHLTLFLQSFIVSSVVLGGLIGSFLSGPLAQHYGPQRMLLITSILFLITTLLSALAPNIFILVIARLLTGTAIGMVSYLSPLFISEMAPTHLRGRLVLLNSVMITSGQMVAFLVGYFLLDTASWRLMFLVGLMPALVLFSGMLFIPPSPRWLMLKGKIEEASAIFTKIRKHENIAAEIKTIQQQTELKPAKWETIFSKKLLPVLLVGLGLGVFQQFVGINAIMYFAPMVCAGIGLKTIKGALAASAGIGIVNMLTTLVVFLLIDHYGRRTLLLIGLHIACIALFFIGFSLTNILTVPALVIYFEILLFIAGYSLSLGTLFWLIISEIYPLNVKGLAMSFVTSGQWLACFLVTISFLPLLNLIGTANVFYLFAFMCFLSIIFSYALVPETKGVSLEQIEVNLRNGKRIRNLGNWNLNRREPTCEK